MNYKKVRVMEMLNSHPGSTAREIANAMDMYGPKAVRVVHDILAQLLIEGVVVRSGDRASGVRWHPTGRTKKPVERAKKPAGRPKKPDGSAECTWYCDEQHDAWMRYWHPDRRAERRAERLAELLRGES